MKLFNQNEYRQTEEECTEQIKNHWKIVKWRKCHPNKIEKIFKT